VELVGNPHCSIISKRFVRGYASVS